MRTLCLYYTRTNTTKAVMERIAELLGADTAEYTDGKERSGVLGYIGACFASFGRKLPGIIVKGNPDFSTYDRVVIGMPIWAEGPCVVGKALVSRYGASFPGEVFFVITQMGKADYTKKVKALDELLGRPSAGHVFIRTKDNDYIKDAEAFAAGMTK